MPDMSGEAHQEASVIAHRCRIDRRVGQRLHVDEGEAGDWIKSAGIPKHSVGIELHFIHGQQFILGSREVGRLVVYDQMSAIGPNEDAIRRTGQENIVGLNDRLEMMPAWRIAVADDVTQVGELRRSPYGGACERFVLL